MWVHAGPFLLMRGGSLSKGALPSVEYVPGLCCFCWHWPKNTRFGGRPLAAHVSSFLPLGRPVRWLTGGGTCEAGVISYGPTVVTESPKVGVISILLFGDGATGRFE